MPVPDDETPAVGPVYLAGPITPSGGRTLDDNIAQAIRALAYLSLRRVAVICPQALAGYPELNAVGYEDWMAIDFLLLRSSRAVLVLPGWESSAGTKREIAFAGSHDVPVFFSVRPLCAFLGIAARAARPPKGDR